MNESKLKIVVGLFVVLSHLAVLMLIIVLFVAGGFLFEEMTTTIALVIPMFSIYTTAVIKYIISEKSVLETKGNFVTKSYVFVSLLLPILFVVSVATTIWLKAFNIAFANFEQFKIMLGVLEAAFGTYMGIVLSSMFEIKKRRSLKLSISDK